MTIPKNELLEHALIGFEAQRAEIDRKIADIQLQLRGNESADAPRPKRVLSPEGRARIIAATKKRWARLRRLQRAKG
jgi:hypothetical protein